MDLLSREYSNAHAWRDALFLRDRGSILGSPLAERKKKHHVFLRLGVIDSWMQYHKLSINYGESKFIECQNCEE